MAVTITRTADPAGVAHTANVTTYSAQSVGAAAPDRLVVIVIGKEVATVTVSGVTITDDIGTRSMQLIGGTTFGNNGAWMYRSPVSFTATTATFAITWSGAVTAVQNHMSVYVVKDGMAPPTSSGTDTSTDMDATDPLTTGSTTIPTGGGMLAAASCATDTVAKTWANLTEDLDADAGAFRWTTATSTSAGTATRTCTGATDLEDGVLVWAIFSPSANSLQVNMPPPLPAGR